MNQFSGNIRVFISAVESRPILYNSNLKEYYNKNLIQNLWEEIAAEFNTEASYCKAKWTSLRCSLARQIRNEKSPNESQIDNWYLADNMAFIREFSEKPKGRRGRKPKNWNIQNSQSPLVADSSFYTNHNDSLFSNSTYEIKNEPIFEYDSDSTMSLEQLHNVRALRNINMTSQAKTVATSKIPIVRIKKLFKKYPTITTYIVIESVDKPEQFKIIPKWPSEPPLLVPSTYETTESEHVAPQIKVVPVPNQMEEHSVSDPSYFTADDESNPYVAFDPGHQVEQLKDVPKRNIEHPSLVTGIYNVEPEHKIQQSNGVPKQNITYPIPVLVHVPNTYAAVGFDDKIQQSKAVPKMTAEHSYENSYAAFESHHKVQQFKISPKLPTEHASTFPASEMDLKVQQFKTGPKRSMERPVPLTTTYPAAGPDHKVQKIKTGPKRSIEHPVPVASTYVASELDHKVQQFKTGPKQSMEHPVLVPVPNTYSAPESNLKIQQIIAFPQQSMEPPVLMPCIYPAPEPDHKVQQFKAGPKRSMEHTVSVLSAYTISESDNKVQQIKPNLKRPIEQPLPAVTAYTAPELDQKVHQLKVAPKPKIEPPDSSIYTSVNSDPKDQLLKIGQKRKRESDGHSSAFTHRKITEKKEHITPPPVRKISQEQENPQLESKVKEKEDPNLTFIKSILPDFKKLNGRRQRLLKQEILQDLNKLLDDQENECFTPGCYVNVK